MGEARRAAEEITSAIQAQDWDRVRSWVADGFTFHDPSSPAPPMNIDEWIASNQATMRAFPDFDFNFEILEEEGDRVWVRTTMEGTHEHDWDLSAMEIGVIPATHQRVSAAPNVTVGEINAEGRVEYIEVVEGGPDSGVPGLLQQLGVEMG